MSGREREYNTSMIGLDIHEECKNQCRSFIIQRFLEQHPDPENELSKADEEGYLPLHRILLNHESSLAIALMVMEKCPELVKYPGVNGYLPLQMECDHRCRSAVISRCIEVYPEALAIAKTSGSLPLHRLLWNPESTIEVALMMFEKYPTALQHQNGSLYLPIHIESWNRCRSIILMKCIELYPEALEVADENGYLPLHCILEKKESSVNDALMMIEKYSAALQHGNYIEYLPLHIECEVQCRLSIISICIELYPQALAHADHEDCLPLHRLLENKSSPTDVALMMIEKYPEALQHHSAYSMHPLHTECWRQCRLPIISKCIELYPYLLDNEVIKLISQKIKHGNFSVYAPTLSIIFTARPMFLYCMGNVNRDDPHYRRCILNLLPRHVFTSTHEADYRVLNWQSRVAMMMLLSQMQIQHTAM
jgi:hypothetical protein